VRPITPQPGFTESDLITLLATREFIFVEAYTILTKDQGVRRYSTAQKDVDIQIPVDGAAGPVVFTSRQVQLSGIRTEMGVGVEVDEQTLNLAFPETLTYIPGLPFSQAIRLGRFDGATVRRDRYFRKDWISHWVGGVPMFVGKVSSIDRFSRSNAQLKVKSDLALLNTPMPRKLMQATCLHTLFDPGCGLYKLAYQTAGVVGSGSTIDTIYWSGANSGFALGTIEIEDAGGVTIVRTIDRVDTGVLYLASPLESIPIVGMNFKAYPGCNRTYARCNDFNNRPNYQGFPFVPTAETAL